MTEQKTGFKTDERADFKVNLKRKMTKIFGKEADFGEFSDESCIEGEKILNIPCDLIRPNRAQPRADFDDGELLKLAESIRRYGIIQPLTVRKAEIDDIYDYELIAGERRLRAARLLELYAVPCIVIDADEQISAELAIVENIMRRDLNMFETAYALRNLGEDYGLTQEEIASKMSMSQSAVANKIRLLKLTYKEQQLILSTSLTERHARALLKIQDAELRIRAILHISDFNLNVKDSEAYIERLLKVDRDCENSGADSACDEGLEISSVAGGAGDRIWDDFTEERLSQLDKGAAAVVRNIRKKLEALQRVGRQASIELESGDESIELHIRIEK